jgi:predicted nicotinamide N-methyase
MLILSCTLRYASMSLTKVSLLPSTDLLVELDRDAIVQGLESINDGAVLLQLERIVSWTSHDGLSAKLRCLRLTPVLIKLLNHPNEQIVENAASAMSYMSGRSAAGPFYRHWTFIVTPMESNGSEHASTISIYEPAYSSGAGLGWKTWNAALVLVEFFGQNITSFAGKDILELGCGTGLSGIFCAKFGARSVLMTDYNDKVLETVAINASRNDLKHVTIKHLDWTELLKTNNSSVLLEHDIAPFDTIIGSDIVYDPEHATIVPKILNLLLSQNEYARAYIAIGPRPESTDFQSIMTNDYHFEVELHTEPFFVDSEGNTFHHDLLVYKRPSPRASPSTHVS